MKKAKEKENKKPILFVYSPGPCNSDYVAFLSKRWNVKLVDILKDPTQSIDLILFTGGADVSPSYYGEEVGEFTQVNIPRDRKDFTTFEKFQNVPKLGICRGAQFLTVANGAKLIQDVKNHAIGKTHSMNITVEKWDMYDYKYEITSTHHQMMNPFCLNKEAFQLIAFSTCFLSPSYLNGLNSEIKLKDDFLEPEIVFYKKSKSLAIQGHPEMRSCPLDTKELCLDLIEEYLLR